MRTVKFLSILVSVVFIFLSFFSVSSYANLLTYWSTYTVEDFVFLRDCVLAGDEAGVISFFKDRGVTAGDQRDPYDIASFDRGRSLLERLDEIDVVAIEGAPEETTYEFTIEMRSVADFRATYESPEWKLYYSYNYYYASEVSDVENPAFVLETVDGETLKFKYTQKSGTYDAFTYLSGKLVKISFSAEKPPSEDIGKVKFVPFSELTSVAGSATTDLTDSGGTTDALPEIDLKWWHVALPVGGGIAVIGSLAAVLLLRKKKKQ